MHILQLTASNVKRLTAIEIRPDGNIVEIRGANAAGKSSVIDSIAYALGGVRLCPEAPIRAGQATAEVSIDLGDLHVTRKWTKKDSYLAVTSKDGLRLQSPQAIRNKLVGALTFDPLEFSRMDPASQRAQLVKLTGIGPETERLARDEQTQMGLRRDAKVAMNEYIAARGQIAHSVGAPDEPVSVVALTQRLEKCTEIVTANNRARRDVSDAENDRDLLGQRVERIDDDIAGKKRELKLLEIERERMAKEYSNKCNATINAKAECAKLADPELQPIRDQIAAAEETNRQVELRKRWKDYDERVRHQDGIVQSADAEIKKLRQGKEDLLAAVEFPLEGLGFDEGGVRFQGIPFEQCSSAERLTVSVVMAMRMNPKLKVLMVRDGSLLDDESLKALYAIVREKKYQLWIERVGGEGEGGVLIEDGAVREAEEPKVQT